MTDFKDINDITPRDRSSAVKIAVSSFIAAAVATVFVLVGIFVIDRFNATAQTGLEYWTEKILTGVATFSLMLATANICEETRKRRDTNYGERMRSIDEHYKTVLENGEVDDLEEFITNVNIANKYRAFVRAVKKRIRIAVALKKEDKRKELEKQLLLTAEEVWEDVRRVKYHKITYSQLFEGAQDVSQNEDDNDLNVHRFRYTMQKLAWKIVSLVAFGAVATDIAFSFVGFTGDMAITLVLKICTMLVAAYSGISFGYSMVERTKVVLRRKTRVLSQFRARVESGKGDDRFAVTIPRDIYVEKVRAAFEAEQAAQTEEHTPASVTVLPAVPVAVQPVEKADYTITLTSHD